MWTASAPVRTASPAPGVVGGSPQRLDDQVDRLEHVGAPVDAVADLTGTDQDRCAGIDQSFLPNLTAWSTLGTARRAPTIRRIDVLVLCTANQCRSPMAEVLLRRHLEQAGVEATVSSAGLYEGGVPATDHGVATMADRGLDLSAHRSRQVDADMLRRADLVIAMARQHVREAAVLVPDALAKTFTLKELARGAARGRARAVPTSRSTAGSPGSPPPASPGRSSASATTTSSTWPTRSGCGRRDYEITADLLDRLLGEVVDLAFPVRARAEEQRA